MIKKDNEQLAHDIAVSKAATMSEGIEKELLEIAEWYKQEEKSIEATFFGDPATIAARKKALDNERKFKEDKAAEKVSDSRFDMSLKADTDVANNIQDPYKKEVALARLAEREKVEIARRAVRDKGMLESEYQKEITAAHTATVNTMRRVERQRLADQVGAIGETSGKIGSIFGKQTLAYKAFTSVQIGMDTVQAVMAAYKSTAEIPIVGPVLAPIAAAAAGVFGAEQIAAINSKQVPGYWQGGIIDQPTLGWIGEKGAEVVAPKDRFIDHTAELASAAFNRMSVNTGSSGFSVGDNISDGLEKGFKKMKVEIKRHDLYMSQQKGQSDMSNRRV